MVVVVGRSLGGEGGGTWIEKVWFHFNEAVVVVAM